MTDELSLYLEKVGSTNGHIEDISNDVSFIDISTDSGLNLIPTEMATPDDEYQRLLEEFGLGAILNESAMFRVFRMKQSGKWADVKDLHTGDFAFETWESFIKKVAEDTGKSRQTLFDRVKTYQQLATLGKSPEEMIKMMTESPGLYSRSLRLLCDYNVRTNNIETLNFTDDTLDTDEAIEELNRILEDVASFGSAKDALNYIRSEILLEPIVSVFVNEESRIVVSWYVLDDRSTGIATTGSVEFAPAQRLPDWVAEEIKKKIK